MKPVEFLVVEDDPLDLAWTRHVLAKLTIEHRVVHAADGLSALQMLFGHEDDQPGLEPTLILLDLALPGMDGLSLLERLQAEATTRNIPVFILTGSSEDKLLLESYRLGATAFIVKPLSMENLTAALNDAGFFWTLARRKASRRENRPGPGTEYESASRPTRPAS